MARRDANGRGRIAPDCCFERIHRFTCRILNAISLTVSGPRDRPGKVFDVLAQGRKMPGDRFDLFTKGTVGWHFGVFCSHCIVSSALPGLGGLEGGPPRHHRALTEIKRAAHPHYTRT